MFKNYYPLVYRRLYYLLGERAAAEDLTQEVFLKLYRQPPQDKNNLGGWLLRTAANLAYNRLRDEERRRRREEGQFREVAGIIPLEEAKRTSPCFLEEAKRTSPCFLRI